MKNYLIVSQYKHAQNRVLKLIDDFNSFADCSVGVVKVDANQKDELVFAKRNGVNYTNLKNIDLNLFSHYLKNHVTANKNVIVFFVIMDSSKLKDNEIDYFKKNLSSFNKENIFLIICSEKKSKLSFINNSFAVIDDVG